MIRAIAIARSGGGTVGDNSTFVSVNTTRTTLFKAASNGRDICDVNYKFGEFGRYRLGINVTDCRVTVVENPVNSALPIFTVFLVLITVKLTWEAVQKIYRSRKCRTLLMRLVRLCHMQPVADDLADNSLLVGGEEADDVLAPAATTAGQQQQTGTRVPMTCRSASYHTTFTC
jgi:hypothetical protein